jgi:hypothetical protein
MVRVSSRAGYKTPLVEKRLDHFGLWFLGSPGV